MIFELPTNAEEASMPINAQLDLFAARINFLSLIYYRFEDDMEYRDEVFKDGEKLGLTIQQIEDFWRENKDDSLPF